MTTYLVQPAATFYTTRFAGAAENPISQGSRWTNGLATGLKWCDPRVLNGRCFGTQDGNGSDGLNTAPNKYNDTSGILTGTWPNDQMAEGTIFNDEINGNWNSEVEVLLRFSTSANVNSGYEFNVRVKNGATPYVEIVRWNGAIGIFTRLSHLDSASVGVVTGDIIRAVARGSVLELWLRQSGVWTKYISYNTSTGNDGDAGGNPGGADSIVYAGGSPGLGFYLNNQGATGDPSRSGFTAFTATGLQ